MSDNFQLVGGQFAVTVTYDALSGRQGRSTQELTRGNLRAANAALEEVDHVKHVHFTDPEVLVSLRRTIDASAMSPQGSDILSGEVDT